MTVFNSIGVLGAGTMGSNIAARIAVEGRRVILVDTKPEFIERALHQIRTLLDTKDAIFGRHYPENTNEIMKRIVGTCDSSPLREVPFVVECIPEDTEAKHDTLKYLADLCKESCVFGTSITSTTVCELLGDLPFGDRVVGFHFFARPNAPPLVELAVSEAASVRAVHVADRAARVMGAVTVRCRDEAGYIVKRMQAAFYAEALRLLNEGKANIPTIDASAQEALGVMGPFETMNTDGIHIAEFAARGALGRLPDLYVPSERLKAQAASKELWNTKGDIDNDKTAPIRDRFLSLMLLVGMSIVDEEIADAEDVTWAMRCGLGYSEGPFDAFNRLGFDRALTLVSETATVRNVAVPEVLKSFSSKTGLWNLSYVQTDVEGETAWVTVRRPDTRNALDEELVSQLDTTVKKLEKNDQVKTVVFGGMGDTLVSGPSKRFLVDKLESNDPDGILSHYKRIHSLFSRIAELQKITIARPRGVIMDGGFEFCLACRYLIASPRAVFGFPETGLGIHPAMGATQRLPRKAGKSIGKYLIMTGDVITAEAAERLGVADAVVDDDDAVPMLTLNLTGNESLSDDEAGPSEEELGAIQMFGPQRCQKTLKGEAVNGGAVETRVAKTLREKAPCALSLINKLIDDGLGLETVKALALELSAFKLILSTKDALLGLKSAGKTPKFTGQ
jgi:enoyl-CoA hydratase/3-hydroxyacyl-CoA dehydrogenase